MYNFTLLSYDVSPTSIIIFSAQMCRSNELTPAQAAHVYGRPRAIPSTPIECNTLEYEFFEKVKLHFHRKDIFPESSKSGATRKQSPYAEFIKCIHLFAVGVLNKDELIQLLRGLFIMGGNTPKSGAGTTSTNSNAVKPANILIADLEKVIMGRGPYAHQGILQKCKSKYGAYPLREYDLTETSKKLSPSYWSYPSDFVFDKFSGETSTDARVLNFDCFSMAKDWIENGSKICKSIEEYDGVKTRRNAHEGVMNRVRCSETNLFILTPTSHFSTFAMVG